MAEIKDELFDKIDKIEDDTAFTALMDRWRVAVQLYNGDDSAFSSTSLVLDQNAMFKEIKSSLDSDYIDKDINPRFVVNYLRKLVQTYATKFVEGGNIPIASPIGEDESDVRLAELITGIISCAWDENVMQQKLIQAIVYACITGISWLKIEYDVEEQVEIEGELYDDPFTGKIKIDTRSPFHIFWNLEAKKRDEIQWVCELSLMPVEKANFLYNTDLEAQSGDGQKFDELENENSDLADFDFKDMVIIREYREVAVSWRDAGHGEGKGRHLVRSCGKTLLDEELDVDPRKMYIPISTENPLHSRLYGQGVEESIIVLQYFINVIDNLLIQNGIAYSNVIFTEPAGSSKAIVNPRVRGSVIKYPADSHNVPAQMPLHPVSEQTLGVRNTLVEWMRFMLGFSDLSMMEMPKRSSQVSTKSIQLLATSEGTRIYIDTKELEVSLKSLFEIYIEIASQQYQTDRITRIIGKNDITSMVMFQGSDLSVGNYEVKVELADNNEVLKQVKTDAILNLFDRSSGRYRLPMWLNGWAYGYLHRQ